MRSSLVKISRFALTALGFVLYVNTIPFASRLIGGLDWVSAYFPKPPDLVSGLLFMGVFGSLPAIILVVAYAFRARAPIAFAVSLISTSSLLLYWHHDYDLSADAQAGLGFVFFPLYTFAIAGAVYAVVAMTELVWGYFEAKICRSQTARACSFLRIFPARFRT